MRGCPTRSKILGLAAVGLLVLTTSPASAVSTKVVFTGRNATATVTDCVAGQPVGSTCTAALVGAGLSRLNDNGTVTRGSFIDLTVVEVTITETGFDAVPVAEGSTTAGKVTVAENLSRATARGQIDLLTLCPADPEGAEPAGCVPTATRVRLDATWKAIAPAASFTMHSRSSFDGCTMIDRYRSRDRDADASVTLDGTAFQVPPGFGAAISSSKTVSITDGCDVIVP